MEKVETSATNKEEPVEVPTPWCLFRQPRLLRFAAFCQNWGILNTALGRDGFLAGGELWLIRCGMRRRKRFGGM
jgi:hypothetical protein